MTKERLEELIKQGATIYCPMNKSGYIAELDLSSGDFTVASDCSIVVENEITGHWYGYGFEQLYETREQAEWALKTTAERTERFEPPMWDDISEEYTFYFGGNSDLIYSLIVRKKLNLLTIGNCAYFGDCWCEDYEFLYEYDCTKENYEKACEIVRDLFREGK